MRDLGTAVTPADLPDLERGFLKGLRSVKGSKLERHERFESPYHIGVEAVQTYLDGDVRRKRWVRLLYRGAVQARLIAQGKTGEEYDRMRIQFAPCMSTFLFGEIWA